MVVVPEKSGALITARHALEAGAGRDVWTVPGSIGFAGCQGSNALLADGAGVLWDVERFAHTVAPELASQKLTVTEAGPALADLPEKEVVALAGVGFKPASVHVISGHSGIEVRELLLHWRS